MQGIVHVVGVEALAHAGAADLSDAALVQVVFAALGTMPTLVQLLATVATPMLFAGVCGGVEFRA